MANILVVEDDVNTNEAVCEYLRSIGHSVTAAFDGNEASALFALKDVDLVILDIMLPGMTGLGVLQSIRETSSIPVLMLTALEDEWSQIESFDRQADDYITKPFSLVILGKHVGALLRRSSSAGAPQIWKHGDLVVNFSGYSACDKDGPLDVTAKEMDLLKFFVENEGLVLSRTQILNTVWGADCLVLDRLVDTYIKNLRKKLHLDCIRTVKGVGYKLEPRN